MTLDRAVDRVLERLSDGQIEALAVHCEQGTDLSDAVVGGSLASRDAVDGLAAALHDNGAIPKSAIGLALRVGLRARIEASARRARPVWTGPGAHGEQRLTASVLHELITSARERILLVSYAAFTLAEVAADLTQAVGRGVDVDVVFETEEDSTGAYHGSHATPFGSVPGIRRWRWPSDQRPESGAVLHAKLLVVDGRQALVGSANLTQRALNANLEAGVLIADPDVAAGLERHVRVLMNAGVLAGAEA